jgi:hypothetical protein
MSENAKDSGRTPGGRNLRKTGHRREAVSQRSRRPRTRPGGSPAGARWYFRTAWGMAEQAALQNEGEEGWRMGRRRTSWTRGAGDGPLDELEKGAGLGAMEEGGNVVSAQRPLFGLARHSRAACSCATLHSVSCNKFKSF